MDKVRRILDSLLTKQHYGHSLSSLLRIRLVRNIVETFFTKVVLLGLGLITSVIITRALGPEGRGLFAVAGTITALGVQLGNLGLHAANTYTVAKNPDLISKLFSNSLFTGFVCCGAIVLLVSLILNFFQVDMSVSSVLLLLSLVSIPIGLVSLLLQSLLLGINKVREINIIDLVAKITTLLLTFIIIRLWSATAEGIFLGAVISSIISILWTIKSLMKTGATLTLPCLQLFKDNLAYGIKAYLAAVFGYMVLRIDLMQVNYLLGAEATGYYSVAVAMADMIYMFPVVVSSLLFPKLSAMSDFRLKLQYADRCVIILGIVMLIGTIIPGLLAEYLLKFLYGEAFINSVPAFRLLLPGIFILSINGVYMNLFASLGMPVVTIYSPLIAFIVNVSMNFYLIPLYGVSGASLSSVVAYSIMFFLSQLYLLKLRNVI